jgi:hypothetical protein
VYVQQHFSKKEVELQIKQPNSAFNMISLKQNKNTIVIRNKTKVTQEEIIQRLETIGKVISYSSRPI